MWQLREGIDINKSLLTLGTVIAKLSEGMYLHPAAVPVPVHPSIRCQQYQQRCCGWIMIAVLSARLDHPVFPFLSQCCASIAVCESPKYSIALSNG